MKAQANPSWKRRKSSNYFSLRITHGLIPVPYLTAVAPPALFRLTASLMKGQMPAPRKIGKTFILIIKRTITVHQHLNEPPQNGLIKPPKAIQSHLLWPFSLEIAMMLTGSIWQSDRLTSRNSKENPGVESPYPDCFMSTGDMFLGLHLSWEQTLVIVYLLMRQCLNSKIYLEEANADSPILQAMERDCDRTLPCCLYLRIHNYSGKSFSSTIPSSWRNENQCLIGSKCNGPRQKTHGCALLFYKVWMAG